MLPKFVLWVSYCTLRTYRLTLPAGSATLPPTLRGYVAKVCLQHRRQMFLGSMLPLSLARLCWIGMVSIQPSPATPASQYQKNGKPKNQPFLSNSGIINQKTKKPNVLFWFSGLLFRSCSKTIGFLVFRFLCVACPSSPVRRGAQCCHLVRFKLKPILQRYVDIY